MALSVERRDHRQLTARAPAVWEPFRELDELQRRSADLMEAVWSGGTRAGDDLPWVPPVDVEETDDAWTRRRRVEVQAAQAS